MTSTSENGSSALDEAHAADEPHPEAQVVLDALEAMGAPSIADLTPEEAHEQMDTLLAVDSSIEVASVEDRRIDGPEGEIPIRIYDPAYEENGEDYVLTIEESEWFRDHYFEREIDAANILAAPRLANDRLLSRLPPATVLTAGFDPLRDDGAAYADRLEAAGVPVSYRNYPGMIHGFFGMLEGPADLSVAHEAHDDLAADLRDALE